MVINKREVVFFHRGVKELKPIDMPQPEPSENEAALEKQQEQKQAPAQNASQDTAANPDNAGIRIIQTAGGSIEILGPVGTEGPEIPKMPEPQTPPGILRDMKYQLTAHGNELRVGYTIRYDDDLISDFVTVPLIAPSYYDIFYNGNLQMTVLKNLLIVNPYTAQVNYEYREGFYLGKVMVTDSHVLVYLRGGTENMPGMKNIIMDPKQNSVREFCKFSKEADRLIKYQHLKRQFLFEVDTLDSTSYLEAQLDVLTKIVLDSGIADKSPLKAVLQKADSYGIYRHNSRAKLISKMEDKRKFREKQLRYYKAHDEIEEAD